MSKITRRTFVPLLAAAAYGSKNITAEAGALMNGVEESGSVMWFNSPAATWIDALPVGNGRLGGMVFGGAIADQIALNEDTLYSGFPHDTNNPHAREILLKVRNAVLEHQDYHRADRLCREMQGPFCQAYQPLGDLYLTLENNEPVTLYRRELNLDTAIARTAFQLGSVQVSKACFVSVPDDVLVVHVETSEPLSWTVRVNSQLRHTVSAQERLLTLQGKAPSVSMPNYVPSEEPIRYSEEAGKGMYFAGEVRIFAPGGEVSTKDETLKINHARTVTLFWQ